MEPIKVNDSGHKSQITMKSDVVTNDFDQKVDVVGLLGDNGCFSSKKVVNDPDGTEDSSSFGNTFSGSDEESVPNDMEVESHLFSKGLGRHSKNRRVTDHWRTYISPLKWRCQWLELRMNELRSQALSYERDLAAYGHEKQLNLKMMEVDDSVSREIPFSCLHRRRAMKRRRRKRVEDNINASSYMWSHNVFSYYESKSTKPGCQTVDTDSGIKEAEVRKIKKYERLLQGLRSDDKSLEEMILNLDHLQYRVLSLKSQLGKVVPQYSHIGFSHGNKRHIVPARTTSYNELKMSGSSFSSFGDAGVISTNSAPFHTNFVKIEEVEDLSNDDTRELNDSTEEEEAAPYRCEDAMAYLKMPVLAPAVIRTCTGKRRGRKPKKQLQSWR